MELGPAGRSRLVSDEDLTRFISWISSGGGGHGRVTSHEFSRQSPPRTAQPPLDLLLPAYRIISQIVNTAGLDKGQNTPIEISRSGIWFGRYMILDILTSFTTASLKLPGPEDVFVVLRDDTVFYFILFFHYYHLQLQKKKGPTDTPTAP